MTAIIKVQHEVGNFRLGLPNKHAQKSWQSFLSAPYKKLVNLRQYHFSNSNINGAKFSLNTEVF